MRVVVEHADGNPTFIKKLEGYFSMVVVCQKLSAKNVVDVDCCRYVLTDCRKASC